MNLKKAVLIGLSCAVLPAAAQNNPYDIDDACYVLFMQVEDAVGTPTFVPLNEALLRTALAKKDTKAETLYYVEVLKHQTRFPEAEGNDKKVDGAQARLKQVAKEYGFSQYYYYAYQLAQNYYYNSGKPYRTLSLVQEMQETALKENDMYGIWTGSKYLASLYIEQNDYVSAKKYIVEALRIYNTTEDATVRRQSPTRLYCDLADTFPIGTDSVRFYVAKARESSRLHLDTLRFRYYEARLTALDGNRRAYRALRDYCLADPHLEQISRTGKAFFDLIDAVFDGSIVNREEEVLSLASIREMKVIANICENQGYKDFAFDLEKRIVNRMENALSVTNQSRLSELDVTMGKAALSADLLTKEHEISLISSLLSVVLAILFAVSVFFFLIHIRNLKRNKKRDEERIVELKEANERAKVADAAKTRFVQNMSHEVRTPLNAIVGFSQLLSLPDGSLQPEEKEEFAGHIVNNSKMLTMLLDDILNASDMDQGNYRITYEEGDCDYLCQAAISSAEHRLQPGVRMEYVPVPGGPHVFRTDPRRVQQILLNLLTNACKHTMKGRIVLACSLDEHPGEVTFSVTDTGPGVPADQAERIFDRFTKLNEFVQGTGLGLSICRDIAGRMGGRVYLDTSYTEGGARFVFVLPDKKMEDS